MSRIVQVHGNGLSLPDGRTYDSGAIAELTDDQFSDIHPAAFSSGLVTDVTTDPTVNTQANAATLGQVLASLEALANDMQRNERLFPPRALQYARDQGDVMRVTIANNPLPSTPIFARFGDPTNPGSSSPNNYPLWYGAGSPNSIDAREEQREFSQQTFNSVRMTRWVVS